MIILVILISQLLHMYSRLLQKVHLVYFEFILLFHVFKPVEMNAVLHRFLPFLQVMGPVVA
jgi:hypothetical protein